MGADKAHSKKENFFMSNLNRVMLIGRLGQDPTLKYTPSQVAVCELSLATSEKWTDNSGAKQERTEWHKLIAYSKSAELINQYMSKGKLIYIEGKITYRSWEKDGVTRYTTEIIIQNFQFLEKADTQAKTRDGKPMYSDVDNKFSTKDIPF